MVVTMVVWLFEFATHLHIPSEQAAQSGSHVTHVCGYCASFPGGAGAVSALPRFAPAGAQRVAANLVESIYPATSRHDYFSRGPPIV
jgi:hypothetical protein